MTFFAAPVLSLLAVLTGTKPEIFTKIFLYKYLKIFDRFKNFSSNKLQDYLQKLKSNLYIINKNDA